VQQWSHVVSLITNDRNEADTTYDLNNICFFFRLKSSGDVFRGFWTSNHVLKHRSSSMTQVSSSSFWSPPTYTATIYKRRLLNASTGR
jgi:hypothetical protein